MFLPSLIFSQKKMLFTLLSMLMITSLTACSNKDHVNNNTINPPNPTAKNVIFFLGDGMGIRTLTAARIYAVGEEGDLTMDTLPESAFVRTFSEDGQVTDSAPSMGAYMTGVKMKNEVISMQTGTVATTPNDDGTSTCGSASENNGKQPAETLLELAKAQGMSTGVVTTTRITHATPASTYAHVCHRDAENDIASQLVPGGKGTAWASYNTKLLDGVDVILGGGLRQFKPLADGGKRADGRDLVKEMQQAGYQFVRSGSELAKIEPNKTGKLLGLFNASHMNYDLDRIKKNVDEPSLAAMTTKAIDTLQAKNKSYFLMVEGGRIDHALHDTNAKRALQDTVAFDDAIRAAIELVKKTDPELKNTLIVVTADHDHTIVLNGYAKRTGKYIPGKETSVLGVVKNYNSEGNSTDDNGTEYPIISFGNGKKRLDQDRLEARGAITDSDDCRPVSGPIGKYTDSRGTDLDKEGWCTGTAADDFQQEAIVQTGFADSETHGGTDVFLGALGVGSELFHGSLENIEVFDLIRKAIGLNK